MKDPQQNVAAVRRLDLKKKGLKREMSSLQARQGQAFRRLDLKKKGLKLGCIATYVAVCLVLEGLT